MSNDSIAHFGVKGMKWGVRRQRGANGRVGQPDISNMSDKELRDIVSRMNMEQQYKNLSSKKISQGQSSVKKALAVGATVNSVIAFSKSPAGRALMSSLEQNAVHLVGTGAAVSTIGR